jgi:hypothetical protein
LPRCRSNAVCGQRLRCAQSITVGFSAGGALGQTRVAATLGMPRRACAALRSTRRRRREGHVYPEDLLILFLVRKLTPDQMDRGPARDLMCPACAIRSTMPRSLRRRGPHPAFTIVFWSTAARSTPRQRRGLQHIGPYRIDNFAAEGRSWWTKVANAPYRGPDARNGAGHGTDDGSLPGARWSPRRCDGGT